jgi:4-hydroxythreonine-4-phosphate dehydrogenase
MPRGAPAMRGAVPLLLTPGEPAGIGPDLTVMLAQTPLSRRVVVYADPDLLAARARRLRLPLRLVDAGAPLPRSGAALRLQPLALAAPARPGRLDPRNAGYVLDCLRAATAACRDGSGAALVTGPVQKSVIADAGVPFTGQTEFVAALCGGATPVMMLVAGQLRVALATTHLPLRAVAESITADRLEAVLRTLHRDLRRRFGIAHPRILVCGLNPHAGEQGHLGREELDIIAPLLQRLRRERLRVIGPLPADTLFTPRQLSQGDAVLAMYHDQGLPVLKYAGFGRAVNLTLGLPILRASVDHGTALDLAGRGSADPGSLYAALRLAATLGKRRA